MLHTGTTTFDASRGYGLSRDGELRSLRLAAALDDLVPQTTTRTALLARDAVPTGYTADTWMDEVEAMVPDAVAAGATALDIFVEDRLQRRDLDRLGALATANNVRLRAHVEQFSTMRSVAVALRHNARSLDHLSVIHPEDKRWIRSRNPQTAAVLPPGAEFMGAEAAAPARRLIEAGAIVGWPPTQPGHLADLSLPLIVGLGVRRYGLSTREALLAVTLNAAYVLDLQTDLGSIEPGKRGDVVLLRQHLRARRIPPRA